MDFKVSFKTKTQKITIRPHWLILEIIIAFPLIIIGTLVFFVSEIFNFLLYLIDQIIYTFQYFIPSGINISDRVQNK